MVYIREAYAKGRGTYGSPRVTAELRAKGIPCGKNRVARLMKSNGIMANTEVQGHEEIKTRLPGGG